MPRLVDLEGFGRIEFPDNATNEQIDSYLKENQDKYFPPTPDPSVETSLPTEPLSSGLGEDDGNILASLTFDPLERGIRNAQIAYNVFQENVGLNTPEEAAADIKRYQDRIAEIPMGERNAKTLETIVNAKGLKETMSALADNPAVLGPVIAESFGTYLPAILGSAAAAFVGAPTLATVGILATVSGSTEYGASFLNSFSDMGIDVTDPAMLARALDNEIVSNKARQYGLKRGIPIAAFDALSFGMAGKLTGLFRAGAKESVKKNIAKGAGEIVQAGTFGASGEATAQLIADGKISSIGSIVLEGVAEGPTGVIEASLKSLKKKVEDQTSTEIKDSTTKTNEEISEKIGYKTKETIGLKGQKIKELDKRSNFIRASVVDEFIKKSPKKSIVTPKKIENFLNKEFGVDLNVKELLDSKVETGILVKDGRSYRIADVDGAIASGIGSNEDQVKNKKIIKPKIKLNKKRTKETGVKVESIITNKQEVGTIQETQTVVEEKPNLTKANINRLNNLNQKRKELNNQRKSILKEQKIAKNKKIYDNRIKTVDNKLNNITKQEDQINKPKKRKEKNFIVTVDQNIFETPSRSEAIKKINEFVNIQPKSVKPSMGTNESLETENKKTTKQIKKEIKDAVSTNLVKDYVLPPQEEKSEQAQNSDDVETILEQATDEEGVNPNTKEGRKALNKINKVTQNIKGFDKNDSQISLLKDKFFSDLYQLATKSKAIARYFNPVLNQEDSRVMLNNQQAKIISDAFLKLPNNKKVGEVIMAATYARRNKRILLANDDGKIIITEAELRNDPTKEESLKINRKKVLGIADLYFGTELTIEGDLVLDELQVNALNKLVELGQFQKDNAIKLHIQQLIEMLNPEDFRLIDVTNPVGIKDILTKKYELASEELTDKQKKQLINDIDAIEKVANSILNLKKNRDTSTYVPLSRQGNEYLSVIENQLEYPRDKNGKPDLTAEPSVIKRTIMWKAFNTKNINSSPIFKSTRKARKNKKKAIQIEQKLKEKFNPNEKLTDENNVIIKDKNGKPILKYVHSGLKENNYNEIVKSLDKGFAQNLDNFLQVTPSISSLSEPEKEQLVKKAKDVEVFQKRPSFFKESKVIAGFEPTDGMEMLVNQIQAFSNWSSTTEFKPRIKEVVDDVDKDETITKQEKNLIKTHQKYLQEFPDEYNSFRNLGFMWFLTDASAAVVNQLQVVPAMIFNSQVLGGGLLNSMKLHSLAMKDVIKYGFSPLKGTTEYGNAISVEKIANSPLANRIKPFKDLNYLISTFINSSRTNQLIGAEKEELIQNETKTIAEAAKPIPTKIKNVLTTMFSSSEALNRFGTYVSAYDILNSDVSLQRMIKNLSANPLFIERVNQKGIDLSTDVGSMTQDQKDGLKEIGARMSVEETQHLYGRLSKPGLTRGFGALLFQFADYAVNQMNLVNRMARYYGPDGKKAAALYATALVGMGGFLGLPFLDDFQKIVEATYNQFAKVDINVEKTMREYIAKTTNPEFADMLARGWLSQAASTDIGRRVTLGTFPITGIIADFLTGRTSLVDLGPPSLGVLDGMAMAIKNAAKYEDKRELVKLLPKPFAYTYKSYFEYPEKGIRSERGTSVLPVPTPSVIDQENKVLTAGEKFLYALGFTPKKIADARRKTYYTNFSKNASRELQEFFTNEIVRTRVALYNLTTQQTKRQYSPQEINDMRKEFARDLEIIRQKIIEHNKQANLNEDYHLIVNPQNTTIEKKVDEAIFGFKKYPKKLQQEIRDIEGSN